MAVYQSDVFRLCLLSNHIQNPKNKKNKKKKAKKSSEEAATCKCFSLDYGSLEKRNNKKIVIEIMGVIILL